MTGERKRVVPTGADVFGEDLLIPVLPAAGSKIASGRVDLRDLEFARSDCGFWAVCSSPAANDTRTMTAIKLRWMVCEYAERRLIDTTPSALTKAGWLLSSPQRSGNSAGQQTVGSLP